MRSFHHAALLCSAAFVPFASAQAQAPAQDAPIAPRSEQAAGSGVSAQPANAAPVASKAAPPAANSDASGAPGEQIIVTARRREESLQNVPVAVVAFGATQLAERQIHSEADLQRTVPGLTIRETEGSNQIAYSIRGQTIDAFTGSALAVVPYVNEVQANGNASSNFYDLDSIQTLKGPQGTLFGRNATGGAVLISTAKPTNDFSGNAQISAGNYNYWELTGVINAPIVSDKVLLRVAGNFARRDGYQKNVFSDVAQSPTRRLGKLDRKSGRASLTLKPVEEFNNTTVFEYTRTGGNSTSTVPWSVNLPGQVDPQTGLPLAAAAQGLYSPLLDFTFGPGAWAAYLAAHPGANPGGYAAAVARQRQLGPWRVDVTSHGYPFFFHGRNYYLTNTTSYNVAEGVTLKNIFGYTYSRSHYNTSEQGAPYFVQCTCNAATGDIGNLEKTKAISDEFQVQGKTGGLTYILGAYYYHSKSLTHWPQTYFEILPFVPYFSAPTSIFQTKDTSKAVFAQVNYDLGTVGLSGLSLTAGARYTWEKVHLDQLPGGNGFNVPGTVNHASVKFHKPSWTLGLDYKATPDLLLYAVTRGSWRSGGLNGVAPLRLVDAAGGGALFHPETAKDVELGAKWGGHVFDRPAHFNVAVYKMWVKNIQRAEFPVVDFGDGQGAHSIAVTINVPEAQIKGFEVDTAVRPIEGLEIGGNLAYTDAKYTKNRTMIFGNLFIFGPYADTPRWAGTAYAQVTIPVDPSVGRVHLRGDIYAQTHQFFSNNDASITPGTRIPGYSLVNARLDWSQIMRSRFSADLFVRNLTNKKYYVGGLSQGASLGENAATPGRPRMYGAELRYAW